MTSVTEYERQRDEQVERNRAKLQQLGVPSVALPGKLVPYSADRRQKKRAKVDDETGGDVVAITPRRSARLAAVESAATKKEEDADAREHAEPDALGMPSEVPPAEHDSKDVVNLPARDGIRAASAVAEEVLDGWVGKVVASHRNPPKAAAVALMARGTPHAPPPRFSKYSGVAELADAVAIFVNLNPAAGRGELYDNAFSEGGRKMTWYASSRMTEQTDAVRRMLSTLSTKCAEGGGDGVEGQDDVRGSKERVLLFLREPGTHYTFCGRVVASAWWPGSRPLQLVWRLCQFDRLRDEPSFQHLLGPVLELTPNASKGVVDA